MCNCGKNNKKIGPKSAEYSKNAAAKLASLKKQIQNFKKNSNG